MSARYDCLVLGAGPAGATVAALVAGAGCRTLLVERDAPPRYHVGESLLPLAHATLRRLGLVERLNNGPFPKKHGVSFCSHDGRQSQTFRFADRDTGPAAHSWQALRSELDEMLWQTARSHGAECRDRTRAIGVIREGGAVVGAVLQTADSDSTTVRAKVVVDATGGHSLLGEKMNLPFVEHGPRRSAIWGYYENARRETGHAEATTHIFRSRDRRSWFWYVPLRDNVVSVGVVGSADHLLRGRGRLASVFEEELVQCPAVLERLLDARLLGELRSSGSFAPSTRAGAGDGWLLVGDALLTLDPVFCAGVSVGLRSAELAADAVVAALNSSLTAAGRLGHWQPAFLMSASKLHRLSAAFHDPRFSFRAFLEKHPGQYGALVDVLAGRVFCSTAEPLVALVEQWLGSLEDGHAAQSLQIAE